MQSVIHKGKPRYMGALSDNFECYIINKSMDDQKIPILFSPSSISDNIGASYNQQAIPGGSAPAITYSNTGARTVSIDFFVPIDYLPPGTSFNNTEEYLNALRALVYPRYKGAVVTPPRCLLHLTNIEVDGVCTQCNIGYKADQRYGNDGALGAEVSISIMEVLDKAPSNTDISGQTTILSGTDVGFYEESTLTNGTTHEEHQTFSWGNFKLKGNKNVKTKFKKIRTSSDWLLNQYVPDYVDNGYVTNSGDYSVVKFYIASPIPLEFTGLDIKGDNNDGKSAVYKICINGESYSTSNKVLLRNQIPELTAGQILNEYGGKAYYYIIYTPYVGLNTYVFERALIRSVYCDGGDF